MEDRRMRVKVDIDCTPEEARAFLGLPDVAALQQSVMKDVEGRLRAGLASMEPDALLKMWMPGGAAGLEQMQRAFWNQFAAGGKKGEST
jgi:hypothetical protein